MPSWALSRLAWRAALPGGTMTTEVAKAAHRPSRAWQAALQGGQGCRSGSSGGRWGKPRDHTQKPHVPTSHTLHSKVAISWEEGTSGNQWANANSSKLPATLLALCLKQLRPCQVLQAETSSNPALPKPGRQPPIEGRGWGQSQGLGPGPDRGLHRITVRLPLRKRPPQGAGKVL